MNTDRFGRWLGTLIERDISALTLSGGRVSDTEDVKQKEENIRNTTYDSQMLVTLKFFMASAPTHLEIRELKQRKRWRQRERHKFAYLVGKAALHALHVHFPLLPISLPSSAKQHREIAKFEVL